MAYIRRKRSRQWHFSDAGNRFDGHRRQASRSDKNPISPIFSRRVIRCKRCGSRVVSNINHCPFCGRSLRPFFARLWFWVLVVLAAAGTMTLLLLFGLPTPAPVKPLEPLVPTVVGAPENAPIKNLAVGSTIDSDSLLVTVTAIEDGPLAYDGTPLTKITVLFSNKSAGTKNIYSTQWRLELADGSRLDTFIGTAQDGEHISGSFEAKELASDEQFSGVLYFAGIDPTHLVYAPSALSYSEDILVTWVLPQTSPPQTEGGGEDEPSSE
ncbi:MAG: hypothetical protein LBU48_01630 [Coriobacteriales bacterium]|nr:hypothetical protein [Coriobacteriales bacterium]